MSTTVSALHDSESNALAALLIRQLLVQQFTCEMHIVLR